MIGICGKNGKDVKNFCEFYVVRGTWGRQTIFEQDEDRNIILKRILSEQEAML
jgi:hypothetical protein